MPYQYAVQVEKEFLRTGNFPLQVNHSSVTLYLPGQSRDPVSDPYSVETGYSAGDIDSAVD